MKTINFSFIIPHKNIPHLLSRCVNSIPQRDDIQIIIVDDNSLLEKEEWDIINSLKNEYTEVYLTKEGNGAGYARNVGLSHAKGRWILFADADDFYTDNLNGILDTYKNSEYDIVFFNAKSVYSDTLEVANRNLQLKDFFDLNDIDNFKYSFYPPWCKILKSELIKSNKIKFSETHAANDAIFSITAGWFSNVVKLEPTICYCVTFRKGSLEQTKNIRIIKDRIYISLEVNRFYRNHNINKSCDLYYRHLFNLFIINKREFKECVKFCNSYGYSTCGLIYNMAKRFIYKLFHS